MTEEHEVEVIEGIDQEPFSDHREEVSHHRVKIGRSEIMDSITWALILIWAGVVMLADNLGYLELYLKRLSLRLADVPWHLPVSDEVWTVFFIGLGIILLFGVIIRLLVPNFRHDLLGNAILSIVAFSVAFGRADIIWPMILIALGVSIIVRKAR